MKAKTKTNVMVTDNADAAVDDLLSRWERSRPRPGEYTLRQLADMIDARAGYRPGNSTVYRWMEAEVAAGRWTRRVARAGRSVLVYRPANKQA